jgi:ABC-type glycerol-3-phosphate transport system substrate-binding protein
MMKEHPMHRLISVILLFSLLLFACRSQDNGSAASAVETTITLAAPAGFQAAYEHLIAQFQEDQPRLQVQFVPLSQQQASLSLREQAALADVVLLEGQPPTTDAAAAFLDLTPLMAADPAFDAADFWPGIMDACRAAGVQVGLPFRANASLIFFDKAAFDAAGLPHPEPGWSWEDFRQAAQALTLSNGEQTTRYGFVDSGNPLGLLAPLLDNIIRQSGDTLDGRRIAAELAWYVTLANEDVILSESGSPPHERQAAMWVSSQFGLIAARTALGDDLGLVAFPAATGASQSNPVTAGCALISAGTNHSHAAWTFLHYLSQQALFATGVYPAAPARPSVAQSSGYWEGMGVETAVALRHVLENGWYRRAEMPELATVGEAMTQALSGEGSLAESLPGTVEIQPTAPPPPPDSEAIAVATPRVTPTAIPGSVPVGDVLSVEYFPNYNVHSSHEAITALARTFNESQDRIHVNIQTALPSSADSFGPLEMAEVFDCFAHRGSADVYAWFYGNDEFKEAFYSLSPLLDSQDASFRGDFDPTYLALNQVGGQLYALPFDVQPFVIRYNATLLAEFGVEPPAPDWTTDEFWTLAEAATRKEADRQVYGFFSAELHPENLLLFVPGAKHFFDFDSQPPGAPDFIAPDVVRSLSWLGDMMEAGVLFPIDWGGSRVLPLEDSGWLAHRNIIESGQVAMWVEWVGSGTGRGYRSFQTGTAPYPQSHLEAVGGQTASPTMILISKRTTDPTGCWEWLKFLTSQRSAFAGVPVRYSVMESPAWTNSVGGEAATAYRVMLSYPRRSILHWFSMPYRYWWADALQDVFAGDNSAAILEDIQLRAEVFYDCYAAMTELNAEQITVCRQADPDFRR